MLKENHLTVKNMPQAGPKSSVYKSFITCEDPKGVVDCGIIMRRSKSSGGSQIMHHQKNVENVRISRSSNTRSTSLELVSQEDQLRSSTSSFRVMEVSRGPRRLNYTIDSWSNEEKSRLDDHGRSKHIEKDLLKGALDLQESLVMLGKLQEASRYMNTWEKKHERAYPRPSDGYSPRNSSEEMKKMIRDSLMRKKMSANTEKGSAYSYSESTPSTSSSQSSLHHNTSEHSSVSSQKAKSPSLIAKLMGMEEDYPLKSLQESEKVSSSQRPAFEIARPKVRRFQTAEKRTLKEVLDTMRFKGLLRSNSLEEGKFDTHDHYSHLEMEKNFNGDSPPIVLIKPISVETTEMEAKVPIVRGEEAFYNRRMLRKLRSHEEVSPKPMRSTKERTLKSDKVQQKLEVEVTPCRKTSKEEGAKKQRGELSKHGEGESKMKEMAARKLKASQHVLHKPQKAASDKVKAKTVSKNKSEDLEKLALAKARKPQSGSNTSTKTRASRQPSTVISTSSKRSTSQNTEPISTERRRNQLKKEQPIKEPTEVGPVTKNVVSEEVVRRSNISESSLISSNTDAAVKLIKEEMKTYESQSEGCCNSLLNSIAEATPLSSMQEITETVDDVSEDSSRIGMNKKSVEHGDNLGEFLLSSATFLSQAAELFRLDSNVSTFIQTPSISKSAKCSTRLVLDCANELAECKSLRLSQTVSPLSLLTLQCMPRVRISLENLVEDVCDGIESLRRHSKLASDENLIADSMHSILERDIMCNGRWDIGWKYGFSSDEADQVVCDIERLVFQGLIEEVFA